MKRTLYTADHDAYRQTVRAFFDREVVPNRERWEERRLIDRDALQLAVKHGIAGLRVPVAYGGAGENDYRYRMIVNEDVARTYFPPLGMTIALQDDVVLPYLLKLGTEEQKQRWLPAMATGEQLWAIAMTEPGAGSDLQGMTTTARRDGDQWMISGTKTFISCGTSADLVIVAARTDKDARAAGFSLFVVERDMPGFSVGRKLDKIGLHAQDTADLSFEDVAVPHANLLGTEGHGLFHLFDNLVHERIGLVSGAYAVARQVFEDTRTYCRERTAFGQPIGDFQNTRFVLAEMATELDVAEAYVDKMVLAYNAGEVDPVDAAKGKYYLSELQKSVVDRCLQLYGGYGYMREYPIARAYCDARVQTIYAGTTEIMKEIIGRDLAS